MSEKVREGGGRIVCLFSPKWRTASIVAIATESKIAVPRFQSEH